MTRLHFYFERRRGGRWRLVARERRYRKPPPPGVERSVRYATFTEACIALTEGKVNAQRVLPL